jgi:hypothetical protein
VRLLLDELWSPTIAEQLRRRGFDVVAVQEPHQFTRYGGIDDALVFERAQEDGRTIVTDNIGDFEVVLRSFEERHRELHHGVIYAVDPPFNRHRSDFVVGQMVLALEHFLRELPPGDEPFGRAHWLRAAPPG